LKGGKAGLFLPGPGPRGARECPRVSQEGPQGGPEGRCSLTVKPPIHGRRLRPRPWKIVQLNHPWTIYIGSPWKGCYRWSMEGLKMASMDDELTASMDAFNTLSMDCL
jgi:hypothetical protein